MTDPATLRGGRSRTIDISGPVHVVDYGGEGPPLVLIHGLGGSHLNWMLVGPSLAQQFRVLAIDLPGFGLTAPEGRTADVHDQAAVVAQLIREEFGQPATLVGNSMGGLVALLTAHTAPNIVQRLVLVDPPLPPTGVTIPTSETLRYLGLPLVPIIGQRWITHLRNQRSPEEQVDARMAYVAADADRIPSEVRTAGIAMEEERRRMSWSTSAFAEAGRSTAAVVMRRQRFTKMLHAIGAPVLMIHGEMDNVVPVDGADWLRTVRPDWEIVTLTGVGHVAQLEVPEAFVKIVTGWLTRTAAIAPVVVSD